jgi:hypothetical protein
LGWKTSGDIEVAEGGQVAERVRVRDITKGSRRNYAAVVRVVAPAMV